MGTIQEEKLPCYQRPRSMFDKAVCSRRSELRHNRWQKDNIRNVSRSKQRWHFNPDSDIPEQLEGHESVKQRSERQAKIKSRQESRKSLRLQRQSQKKKITVGTAIVDDLSTVTLCTIGWTII